MAGKSASAELEAAMRKICQDHVRMEGSVSLVDYGALTRMPGHGVLVEANNILRRARPAEMPEGERKAFFINAYNLIMIAKVVMEKFETHPEQSGWRAIAGCTVWQDRQVYVGTARVSLDDIEHGVLRNNAKHPGFPERPACFPEGDARSSWKLPLDPRIHAALNCGAKSCPRHRAFSAANVEEELDVAAADFVCQGISVREAEKQVMMSSIFKWFEVDFGADGPLKWALAVAKKAGRTEQAAALEKALADGFKVEPETYDWSLNAAASQESHLAAKRQAAHEAANCSQIAGLAAAARQAHAAARKAAEEAPEAKKAREA